MTYRIRLTATVVSQLADIPDRKIRDTLLKRIEGLAESPAQQGKALVKDLAGLRSVHAAGRYRIIYTIDGMTVVVHVLAVGIRKEGDQKDIYAVARKLLKAGLLG